MKIATKKLTSIGILIAVLIIINVVSAMVYQRFDVTENQRYTLSKAAKNIIADLEEPLYIDIYLAGEFPSAYKRLQQETRYMLEEFAAYNRNLKFNFINPLEDGADANQVAERFYQAGMTPKTLNVTENGKVSESILFPWAVAMYKDKSAKINLLEQNVGNTNEEIVNNSIEQLEYAFADAFNRVIHERSKKIAIMRGNGELDDPYIADFITTIKEYYLVAPFTLDSVATNPQKTLAHLQEFDLILEAKPTQAFTEDEKYVLDQYLMNGGKAIWLTEAVAAEKDSLFTNEQNTALAYPRDLNLTDFFFSYGVRINPTIINSINSAPILLAKGSGKKTQLNPYPWFYSPLAVTDDAHPIVHNLEAVKFDFANPMDTLENGIDKQILLQSSAYTAVEGTPRQIDLSSINKKPKREAYQDGPKPLAVLLEGEFESVYANRIKPFKLKNPKEKSVATQLVVVSDGDVIKNDFRKGKPVSLGYDPFTGSTYGNMEFLLNTVNYLLDDSGLVDIRSKEVKMAFLDTDKVAEEKLTWQLVTIVLPLVLLGIFGLFFVYIRRKRYVK